MTKVAVAVLVFAAMALNPIRAEAALLTINDGADVWTLSAQENCTTCSVTLSVQYTASSARLGDLLQGVEWDIDNPNEAPATTADVGYLSTNTGLTWTFGVGGASSGGCNFNSNQGVCGENSPGFTVAVGTWTWTFDTTFPSDVGTLISGNIRAAYNVDPDGNGRLNQVFSPDGGYFTRTVPEPASMLLFGAGVLAAGYRARRRRVR